MMSPLSPAYWCAPRLLRVAYSAWLLLLWTAGLYLTTGAGREDERLKNLLLWTALPVLAVTATTFPVILYLGGCVVSFPWTCNAVAQGKAISEHCTALHCTALHFARPRTPPSLYTQRIRHAL